jgi:hypothetical protein
MTEEGGQRTGVNTSAPLLSNTMPSIAVVTPISIVPAGRAPALAKGLPVTIDVPGAWDELTVGAVKAALVERFPQVCPSTAHTSARG